MKIKVDSGELGWIVGIDDGSIIAFSCVFDSDHHSKEYRVRSTEEIVPLLVEAINNLLKRTRC